MSFHFRQFSVDDDRSTMKVGTDAVLLGCWAGSGDPARVLEVGAGCGVISLMLAQRFPRADILAIDVHTPSVQQAMENFNSSPWKNRLTAMECSIQDHVRQHPEPYDLIVSNPPFFSNALLPPDAKRKLARHTGRLSFTELAGCAGSLLQPGGTFALILPSGSQTAFEEHAGRHGLHKLREMAVVPVSGKPPNRLMTEWSREKGEMTFEKLTIRNEMNEYSHEYSGLTAAFYVALKL
jgi:tRNA1Val (adenine37-N6)-methyltransferase